MFGMFVGISSGGRVEGENAMYYCNSRIFATTYDVYQMVRQGVTVNTSVSVR